MITYNDIFNDKIISDILAIKREAHEKLSKFPSGGLVGNPDNIEAVLEGYKISAEYKNKLKDILKKNKENDIKNIYVLYYFGRSFIDGSMSKTTSFNDLLEHHKNDTFEQILRKIHDVQYEVMETCWKTAKEKFDKHEQNVTKEKEVFNKRLKLYTKKEGFNFFKFHKKPNKQSTNKVFKDIFNSYNIQETTDIYLAKELLEKIIEETNGLVVVDFLGSENFDHLDYVENDDEILKIYWKYSWGNNENPIPPS